MKNKKTPIASKQLSWFKALPANERKRIQEENNRLSQILRVQYTVPKLTRKTQENAKKERAARAAKRARDAMKRNEVAKRAREAKLWNAIWRQREPRNAWEARLERARNC